MIGYLWEPALVGRDRRTRQIIERGIRLTVVGKTRIEKPRNVGMIQRRENLAFARKAFAHPRAFQRRMDEL
jgi:hypothetical protein